MVNKFKEIKSVEDQIQLDIEKTKKDGEVRILEMEKREEESLSKLREEIKNKRHDMLEEAKNAATAEADVMMQKAKGEIEKLKVDPSLMDEASKIVAQALTSN